MSTINMHLSINVKSKSKKWKRIGIFITGLKKVGLALGFNKFRSILKSSYDMNLKPYPYILSYRKDHGTEIQSINLKA